MPTDNEYFIIPNPIYDVVFRYLMEDLESARLILSTFLNQEIIHIQPEPTEKPVKRSKAKKESSLLKNELLSLFRLDFLATVRLPDGKEEVVMIEVQKAYNSNDYFRFKRYIAENFQKKKEEVEITRRGKKKKVYKPIKLIPIFILNFTIENEAKELFIKTKPTSTCVFHNKVLKKESDFIDNLTYELWIVQIPYLNEVKKEEYLGDEYKTRLYTMLKLFDQQSVYKGNEHRLRLLREKFPKELNRVIQRLQAAASENTDLEEIMCLEDEYLKDLQEMENDLLANEQLLKESRKALEENKKTIEENKKTIEEKEKTIEEKEKTIEEKEKTIEEKEKALEESKKVIINLAKILKDSGLSTIEIHHKTDLPVEEIEKLQ